MCFKLSRCIKNQLSKLTSNIMAKRLRVDKSVRPADINDSISSSSLDTVINNTNMTTSTGTRPSSGDFARLLSPNKSQSDLKEYSVIKLQNGLTALLISDKSHIVSLDELSQVDPSENEYSDSGSSESSCEDGETSEDEVTNKSSPCRPNCEEKLAACALCIGVGSFSDPEEIPGLAHFLEHMIFMGSEKYPKENEFDVFIKKKGGSDNASTECEYTTYYFDCHESHLNDAMEIFSQLFISPLMLKDTMTKEREAIESEFQMSLPNDESRQSQLLCSLADKSNPASKFLWGNLITLRDNVKDDDLYKAVHEFRKRHYSAHRMTLAVQARLPLETLEKWVVECFSGVPNNGLPPDTFFLTKPPFNLEKFCKLYIVEPVKNINHLDLTWVMHSVLSMYKTKPLHYLTWVIGHEGKGSLLSYLRRKLWCFGITVNDGGDGTENNSLYTLFTISLVLTEEGVHHVEEILCSVFQYIKMFQNVGPEERLFNEMQLISETAFRFTEEIPSSDNVEQLSENMHFYPPIDYITGEDLLFVYDPQLIKSFLNKLTPENVNIMISSKLAASGENLELIEPWYGTKYQVKEIQPEWIEKFKTTQINEEFYLPVQNPYIASDFTILPRPSNPDEFPKKVKKDEVLELWYKQDVTFKLPNAFCFIHLISPLPQKSAKNIAMLDLFISVLRQSLSEELYPANVAQLGYGFHNGEKGLVITIHGYNEKLKKLLLTIVDGMMLLSVNMKPDMVMALKDELKRSYFNANLKTSYLAREIRMSTLLHTFWSSLDRQNALEDITFETLVTFVGDYFKHLYIQCLVQGNISMEEAIELGEIVKNGLSCKPLPINSKPEIRVKQLPPGEKFCVVQSFNADDANSVVTNYYQAGLGTIKESCVIEMLLMIMEEPLFDSLRSKQQLGYDVSCSLRDTFGVLGFSISVHCQSDRNKVDFVESCITAFLSDFLQTLKKFTIDEFKEIQESLIKLKRCVDIHLKEEVKRNWHEIESEEYVFDRHLKEIEFIEKLSLEEIIMWYEAVSGIQHKESKFKKLSTQIVGKGSSANDETDFAPNIKVKHCTKNIKKDLMFLKQQQNIDKFILNIKDFNQTLPLYPIHKINT